MRRKRPDVLVVLLVLLGLGIVITSYGSGLMQNADYLYSTSTHAQMNKTQTRLGI